MAYLKILRPVNLLFIALVQVLIKFVLFDAIEVFTTLNTQQFALLLLATILITAGGYVINDSYDVEIDKINKPEKVIIGQSISTKSALTYYMILTVAGVGIGFYLSNLIGRPGFAALFVFTAALLYLYASTLKGWTLLGNLLISVLVALVVLIVGIFDLLPAVTESNQEIQRVAFILLLEYAGFAFIINLMREIVKDLEDINGDKNGGLNTLPIVLGRERTTNIVLAMGVMVLVLLVIYLYNKWYAHQLMVGYFLLLVAGPMIYFCIQAYKAEKKVHYSHLSTLLKIVMLLGMLSICLFPFIDFTYAS